MSEFFASLWTAAHQASLPFTLSQNLLKLMFIETMMPCKYFILCHPHSPPALNLSQLESFPVSWFFASCGQSTRASASASVLSMNIQGWFPLGLMVWSPCCPRGSQESSPTPQFQIISSSVLSLLYGPTLTSIHDYWKNHNFDYADLCWKSNVSAF